MRDGDGKRYMGRGAIQRTGKANYQRAQDVLDLPLVAHPELLEKIENAALSDCLFWSDAGLNRLADCLTGKRDSNEEKVLRAICKKINGGYNGINERVKFYWRCLAVLQNTYPAKTIAEGLSASVAANPAIPEITSTLQAHKNLSTSSEIEIVKEQEKATKLIDYAEIVPLSTARTIATSAWSKTGGRIASFVTWFFALLQAGNIGAYAVLFVFIAGLIILIISQRTTLRRWATLFVLWIKNNGN
jgi:hypothetical protein